MADVQKTPLHDAHVALGAKMVDFGGWSMPLQYAGGILAEHRTVRESVGIFDVSHMGEVDFTGPQAIEAVQGLVTNDVSRLKDAQALYTVACRPSGGIVDDCIVYRLGPRHVRIVVNASNIGKDVAFFREHVRGECEIHDRSPEFALIAVQGPKAVALVAQVAGTRLTEVERFGLGEGECAGAPITAARTGYTGEDGFELFVAANQARKVWDRLVDAGANPTGLGARDTLRLEARLYLYGNDIDESTNPYEAGLGWVVKLDKGDFVGRARLQEVKRAGVQRKLVGFVVDGKGIARHGASVVDAADTPVGTVTSGTLGPSVGRGIGLAYVPLALASVDSQLRILQRGRVLPARVVSGPFYRHP